MQTQPMEYRTDRLESLVIGFVLTLLGGGAVAFWNVERSLQWPMLLILMMGAFFVGIGLLVGGFRREVRLDRAAGVSEVWTFFGFVVARWTYAVADFEAAGSQGSMIEPFWDVMLFGRGGGWVTLRRALSRSVARREIARIAAYLEIPAEDQPRTRWYWIDGLPNRPKTIRRGRGVSGR